MRSQLLIFLIVIFSCTPRKEKDTPRNSPVGIEKITASDTLEPETELIANFSDSLNIGEKGKCKIELIKHRVLDGVYVIVNFFTKAPRGWSQQNTYLYVAPTFMDFEPNISDYNNDGFNDISFISAIAGRGGNEVRRLFIYDDQESKLISIVNSESYPNLQYNKKLDCIDAFLIYGASTTAFARIVGDSLKTFAIVENDPDYHIVKLVDRSGKEKELYRVKSTGVYVRHDNYKPLSEHP